jgi:murein DD-endopeptidase MepM/ murein hydrolase activator NlpD
MTTTGITNDVLNLRSTPDTNGRIVRILQPKTQLTILETKDTWLKVQAPDSTTGYVASKFVDIQSTAPAEPVQPAPAPTTSQPVLKIPTTPETTSTPAPAPTSAPPAEPKKLTLTDTSLNVRSAPMIQTSPDNRIETLIPPAELTPLEDAASLNVKVGTTAAQNLWIKVRTPSGKEGYVAAWLVGFVQPVVVQPVGGIGSAAITGGTGGRSIQSDLHAYIDTIPNNYPIPQTYYNFWAQRERLGLPDPFDISPTKLDAARVGRMPVNGFGPNSFALKNWQAFYSNVCGMHNGLDHIVQTGTPLVAVSDGIIVGDQTVWPFMGNRNDKDIILWCFLPEKYKDAQGRRMLSNVMVAYAHTSNNAVVKRRQVVKAGEVIAISGNPAGSVGNDHLHLEVHLLSGDNHLPRPGSRKLNPDYKLAQPFDNRTPFNPMLFFSERLVKYHLHQGKKIGFGSGPTYPAPATLSGSGLNWPVLDFFTLGSFQYGSASIWTVRSLPWPAGIYDMPTLLTRINNYTAFQPYPCDFI